MPGKVVEMLPDGTEVKPGTALDDTRRRSAAPSNEQRAAWTALGIR
ncbi:hypothetical protein [Streptomyces sp. NPDC018610]